ncbi:MAG: hypothetical protein UR42_C0015G0014 [Candidatus Roizmanbacteria bacterium GW2011_GWA2_33_33]|uniref:Uncharacterized protein n=1 Tax=Candidatus Roizmanbacteria bacterium GW2011_GWA2_33_33 TaxID=1618476 RepID=A0A0G0CJR1_9BACT|nr:MAG: hypothetical protein UR42_C0015G0014 [Candidatus Roizmanbacteria bacterium GW2011_GWA2_33_33]
MKNKIEDWFLCRFIPWFTKISMYFGILVVFYITSYGFNKLLGWDIAYTFSSLILISFWLPWKVKNNRIEREINNLVDEKKDDLVALIKTGNLINYSVLNKIITTIAQRLYEDGLISLENSEDDENAHEKIKKIVFEKYKKIS